MHDVIDDDVLRAILAKAAERDETAFARLIEAYHDDMTRVAFVVSGDVEVAQEAAQAAWSDAWTNLGTMRNPELFRPWLMSHAGKEARHLAQGARTGRTEDGSGAPATKAASAPAYRSDELALARALSSFEDHDREIVGLRYVAALGPEDIGRELGMPDGAVRARIAGMLKRFLEDLQPQQATSGTIEAYEQELVERVRGYSDRAVVPFDAAAVGAAAIAEAVPAGPAFEIGPLIDRLRSVSWRVWAAVAGVLVVVVVASAVLGGGGSGGVPVITAIPTDATRLCRDTEVEARVTGWIGAAAQRSATIEVKNIGGVACLLESLPEPWLIQRPRIAMLIGEAGARAFIRIGPNDVLKTLVTVRNYCGAPPTPPVTVAFRQGTDLIVAAPLNASDASGTPSCANQPGSKNDITMRPWAP